MEMNEYIEKAEEKARSQTNLAKILGISARYIRLIKEGKRCLGVEECVLLADYIKEDRLQVIAASNLVTEKDEKKRKILESCFRKVATVAGVAIITSIMTLSTGSTVQANPTQSVYNNINY